MRIGVISDTHDHLEHIDRALELLSGQKIDLLVHLGDWVAPYAVAHVAKKAKQQRWPVKGVLGNNDGEVFVIVSKNPKEWGMDLAHDTLVFDAGGRKVVLYHGTDQAITDALGRSGAYDVVMTGHTHEQKSVIQGETLTFNPGTLSGYSTLRGGRLRVGEYAVYDSEKHVVELLSFPIL